MKTSILLFSILLFACGATVSTEDRTQDNTKDSLENKQTNHPQTDTIMEPVFTLSMSFREQSKDSHGHTYSYELRGNQLSKKISLSGRDKGRKGETDISVELKEETIEKIKAAISNLELTQNYEKEYPIATSGMIITHRSSFLYGELHIKVSGGAGQKSDLYAKKLARFEILLNYLLSGGEENFERIYLEKINN